MLQAPGCWVLGGREVLPSQLTDLMEKTSSIFMTASSFWCGKFQRYTEIAHYNGPYVPFSQLQQWSVYSHLASFRSQPLLPHPGLFRSKSLTSYYFTSKYFYIPLWKIFSFNTVILLSYFKNFYNIIKYGLSSQCSDLSIFFIIFLFSFFCIRIQIKSIHCNSLTCCFSPFSL